MDLATQYAKALHEVVEKNPASDSAYLKNLQGILKRRGHEKLLPRIYRQFQNLETNRQRRRNLSALTPEMRRTRTLVELYKKLIAS